MKVLVLWDLGECCKDISYGVKIWEINNFCIYEKINWISRKSQGRKLDFINLHPYFKFNGLHHKKTEKITFFSFQGR